jgi:hypothetical protein
LVSIGYNEDEGFPVNGFALGWAGVGNSAIEDSRVVVVDGRVVTTLTRRGNLGVGFELVVVGDVDAGLGRRATAGVGLVNTATAGCSGNLRAEGFTDISLGNGIGFSANGNKIAID